MVKPSDIGNISSGKIISLLPAPTFKDADSSLPLLHPAKAVNIIVAAKNTVIAFLICILRFHLCLKIGICSRFSIAIREFLVLQR